MSLEESPGSAEDGDFSSSPQSERSKMASKPSHTSSKSTANKMGNSFTDSGTHLSPVIPLGPDQAAAPANKPLNGKAAHPRSSASKLDTRSRSVSQMTVPAVASSSNTRALNAESSVSPAESQGSLSALVSTTSLVTASVARPQQIPSSSDAKSAPELSSATFAHAAKQSAGRTRSNISTDSRGQLVAREAWHLKWPTSVKFPDDLESQGDQKTDFLRFQASAKNLWHPGDRD